MGAIGTLVIDIWTFTKGVNLLSGYLESLLALTCAVLSEH